MKKFALAGLALVFLFAGALSFAEDEEATTLNGSFAWEDGNTSGDLEAVFTPTGEDTWDVSFHFTFRNKPHTYSGTAMGSIGNGELSGKVLNENKKRTFTFEGAFDGGVFNGTHAEIGGDDVMETGTLTLQ